MVYLRKHLGKNPFFKKNLSNLKYAFSKEDNTLKNAEVTCVIPTYMEKDVIKYTLESSKDLVSKYIIVDKDGTTVPNIKVAIDQYDLDIDIYIKPEMNLKESWDYAIQKAKDEWILLQDGDEIFYTEGPYKILGLRKYMTRPDIILCAPKVLLWGTLRKTLKTNRIMPPHTLLYHNNGTIRMSTDPLRDHPDMDGWRIGLPHPYLFNCRFQSNLVDERIVTYDPEKYYPYPSIVLKMMKEMDSKYV